MNLFQLVFIPVWIVMCVALIGVLYAIILAILANLSVILLTPERRNETVCSAVGYTCFVVPLLVFQVGVDLTDCLNGTSSFFSILEFQIEIMVVALIYYLLSVHAGIVGVQGR